MKLSEVAIQRPVLASMASAALVLFGVIGYTRLSVRELPDIDPPIISVSTTLPGANAQVVETAVTDVLEEELSTIQGLRTLTSTSAEQTSNITLEFNLDRPVDVAAQDVRDKVSRVRGRLPIDVLEPVIAKQSADEQPFFWLALSSENYDLMQLSDVADRLVKARLQSLPGVGSAGIFGERRYSMRVWVEPDALSARGLTVQDVENAIVSRNVEIPAGRIESTRRGDPLGIDHLRVPAQPAGDGDPRARDSGVDRGDVRDHVFPRLLDQQLHAARAHDRHRHRGGRRDHRAGERLPAPGGAARSAGACGDKRDERNRVRRDRDDDRPRRGIHTTGIPAWNRGPTPQRVWHRGGWRRGHLGVRGAHLDPDALRQDPPHVTFAWSAVPDVRARLQRAGGALRCAAQAGGQPPCRGAARDVGGGDPVGFRIPSFPADSPAQRADPRGRSWVLPRGCAWS